KPNKDDIAGLIYTSGTTGDPKGVLISHGNYASMIKIVRDSFSTFDHNTKSFSILPWAHVFGQVGELYHGSVIGGCCGLMGSRETLLEDIVKIKPNTLIAVPRIFNTIYHGIYAKMAATGGIVEKLFHTAVKEAVKKRETGKASFKLKLLDKIVFEKIRQMFGGELKYAITGSAVMNTDIKMFFQDLGIETWDGYGLTESSLALSFNGPIYGNEMGSVGKPGKFITLKIDKTLTGPDSKDGEIIAYGPNIMQGYLNKPEKTAQVMTEDGGFRTGDKGWLDEKGFLHITGRIKEEYKLSNGKYVHPASIEEEIKLSPLITNAFISGAGKDYNVALVVPDPMAIKNIAEAKNIPVEDPQELIKMEEIQNMLNNTITNQLKGTYGNYEIPKKIKYITEEFSLENGLLTQTLKLKRNKIIEKYGNDLNNLYD
ncbi:MAG: AMP-binding protein, partial [archaeon]|nr:AMP-binding protein [archaeon]